MTNRFKLLSVFLLLSSLVVAQEGVFFLEDVTGRGREDLAFEIEMVNDTTYTFVRMAEDLEEPSKVVTRVYMFDENQSLVDSAEYDWILTNREGDKMKVYGDSLLFISTDRSYSPFFQVSIVDRRTLDSLDHLIFTPPQDSIRGFALRSFCKFQNKVLVSGQTHFENDSVGVDLYVVNLETRNIDTIKHLGLWRQLISDEGVDYLRYSEMEAIDNKEFAVLFQQIVPGEFSNSGILVYDQYLAVRDSFIDPNDTGGVLSFSLLELMPDSSYIYYDPDASWLDDPGDLRKMDKSGNIVWKIETDIKDLHGITQTTDGHVLVVGTAGLWGANGDLWHNLNPYYDPWGPKDFATVAKINSETGEKMWEYKYVDFNDDGFITTVKFMEVEQLSDGSIIVSGFFNDWTDIGEALPEFEVNTVMMKIPENGCFDPSGECGEFQFLDENPVSVFDIPDALPLSIHPNPTIGFIAIEFPDIISGSLSVVSLTGQVVYTQDVDYTEQIKLDLYRQDAGMYVIEVVSKSGERYVERVVLIGD